MSSWFIRRANVGAGGSSPTPPSPTEVDLTSLFTWTNGGYSSSGGNVSASAAKRSNTIDVSAYQGKTMVITWMAYVTASDNAPSWYGLFFYDSDDVVISNVRVPKAIDVEPASGYSIDDYEVVIPSNAVGFKTIYFRSSVSFPISAFSCKVML